jgi:probable phosphoglycerate mutase
MPLLGLIRHAPTTWNEAGKIQGQTDTPLSEAGRAQLVTWTPPAQLLAAEWWSSPLRRCRDTARHLAGRNVPTDPLLMEMDWGDWRGETLPGLRARLGEEIEKMKPEAGTSGRLAVKAPAISASGFSSSR